MKGLMQNWPLTLDKILDHASNWHGNAEIVGRTTDGSIERTNYRSVHRRAKKLSNALREMGVRQGDRVGTLAWNTPRHLETWFGTMGIGAICHTLNPRHSIDQLSYIIDHAGDKIIFVDPQFFPILDANRDRFPSVEKLVLMCNSAEIGGDMSGAICFEDILDHQADDCVWGGFDENTASSLCYTSGTSGKPKGVLYSHRSNFLHSLVTMSPDVMNLSSRDVVLPIVPMFHANAWGLAFSCPAVGAKIVMPGPHLDGASVYELLEAEGVTFSAAVPTVWQMLLSHLQETGRTLTTLKRVVIGGAAVADAMIRTFQDDYGVDVMHAWGMTEVSPLGTLSSPKGQLGEMSDEQHMRYKVKQGRAPVCFDMKIVDDTGMRLPHDGTTCGRLMVKGPYVASDYFGGSQEDLLDGEGFFDTGDIATIDADGFMQITDRAKDVIKSGGEWISSIELENIAAGHPKAASAAVIGVPHPKWNERPILIVKLKSAGVGTKEEFLQFLEGRVPKWWLPDDVIFLDDMPLGSTGKIDKNLLREQILSRRP